MLKIGYMVHDHDTIVTIMIYLCDVLFFVIYISLDPIYIYTYKWFIVALLYYLCGF